MWFGVEYIHAPTLLACDKHEKMDANIWKHTTEERERIKIKANDFEGHSYGKETPPNPTSICVASRGFSYLRRLLCEAFHLLFCQVILLDKVPLNFPICYCKHISYFLLLANPGRQWEEGEVNKKGNTAFA